MNADSVATPLRALAAISYLNPQSAVVPKTEDEALKQVSREFEAIFISELLKSMRSTTLKGGLFGEDRATKMYQEMHDVALAHEMAATGMLGFGELLYADLRRTLTETVPGPATAL